MRYRTGIIILMILCFSFPGIVDADTSLWNEQSGNLYQDMYQDEVEKPPEFKVGDIITVIIEEDMSAVQSANTQTSQDSSIDGQPGLGLLDFFKMLGFSYSDQSAADGEVQRSGKLRADITTVIEKKLSTGNFQLAGSKKISVNGEEQTIYLTGIIRAEDIQSDNTISSKKVAEADIEFSGQGAVSEKQKPGLLERLFNFVF